MNASVLSVLSDAIKAAELPEAKAGELRKLTCESIELESVDLGDVTLPEARVIVALKVDGTRSTVRESFPLKAYGRISESSLPHHQARLGDLVKALGGADAAIGATIERKLYADANGYLTIQEPRTPATAPRRTAEEQAAALIAG